MSMGRSLIIIVSIVLLLGAITVNRINAQSYCPRLTGVLIDAGGGLCGGSSVEGYNEYLVFNVGSFEYDLNQLEITYSSMNSCGCGLQYAPISGFCMTGCPPPITYGPPGDPCSPPPSSIFGCTIPNTGFTINPARVAQLNSYNACSEEIFVSPSTNIIPADVTVMVFSGGTFPVEPFSDAYFEYNFPGLPCDAGPIYVIFVNQNICQGKFANEGSGGCGANRTFSVNFGSVSLGECSTSQPCNTNNATVTYSLADFPSGLASGNYIACTNPDGSCNPPVGGLNGCQPDIFIEPSNNECDLTQPEIEGGVFCIGQPITLDYISVPLLDDGSQVPLSFFEMPGDTPIDISVITDPTHYTLDTPITFEVYASDPECFGQNTCRDEFTIELVAAYSAGATTSITGT